MNEKQRVDEFTAEDGEGNAYRIIEFVENVPAGTLGDPDATDEGLKSLELDSGGQVNANPDGTYTVVGTGQTLVRK